MSCRCCREDGLDLNELQAKVAAWAEYNFGKLVTMQQFLGVVEEVGELAHAILKREQGIRGTKEEHDAAEDDAVGDIGIFLMNYASSKGKSLAELLNKAWDTVKHRDFKKFPKNGLTE